jgi:glutamate formiminotransferase / 5-formyltetrahydrofolate cyclo-ligase
VLESEIVGLVPSAALVSAAEHYLQLERFTPDQVFENRIRRERSARGRERAEP